MHSKTTIPLLVLLLSIHSAVYADDHHKRAPLGFTGVRGKKSVDNSQISKMAPESPETVENDSRFMDKRAPTGFMGMRGKKPYDLWQGYEYPEVVYKRVPFGFMGMRGKKDLEIVGYDANKRVPTGFFGMRGKKEQNYQPYSDYFSEKRVPSMGFFGMRGKKDVDENILFEEKRAPSGFIGMRGKKLQRNNLGFFGMRGKKYPYEFRGKFVGVRGKKMANDVSGSSYYTNDELVRLGQDLDMNQLMLLLTDQNEDEFQTLGDRQDNQINEN